PPPDPAQLANARSLLIADLGKLKSDLAGTGISSQQKIALQARIDEITAEVTALTSSSSLNCSTVFDGWDKLVAPRTGSLDARAQPAAATDLSGNPLLPPGASYQGLDNQLYRVEIHLGNDDAGGPTFKWSRDNATVVTPIERVSGSDVIVQDVGPNDALGFAVGQWVDIIDDETELNGKPGQLLQIAGVSPGRITMQAPPAAPPAVD